MCAIKKKKSMYVYILTEACVQLCFPWAQLDSGRESTWAFPRCRRGGSELGRTWMCGSGISLVALPRWPMAAGLWHLPVHPQDPPSVPGGWTELFWGLWGEECCLCVKGRGWRQGSLTPRGMSLVGCHWRDVTGGMSLVALWS